MNRGGGACAGHRAQSLIASSSRSIWRFKVRLAETQTARIAGILLPGTRC